MKKYLLILLSMVLIFSFTSCKKEKVVSPTSADQVTTELQKIIADNGIERIIAWDDHSGFPSSISSTLGVFWTFSNGFITIGGYGYDSRFSRNLLYLDYYDISKVLVSDGTNPVALILHFRR